MVEPRHRHDESGALGTDNLGSGFEVSPYFTELASVSDNELPEGATQLPVVVFLSTDFRENRPLDNGDISLIGMLQSGFDIGARVCRWTPDSSNPLDGKLELVNPHELEAPGKIVDREAARNWPGGVSLVARWPGDENVVDAAIIVFTGPFGEPRVVRDASNLTVHRSDRIAGYGSGIEYAARGRSSIAKQAFHVVTKQQAEDVRRATGATDISVGGAKYIREVKGGRK